nr:hypothetical protein [Tanacetum cinerariifolium]
MTVQALEEVGEGSKVPNDTHHTPIVTQPSSSQPHKKQISKRKQRKETEVPHIEPQTKESVPTPSNDPLPSAGENVEQSTKDAEKEVSIADPVTIAGEVVTTAEDVTVSTTLQITKDELTLT